MARRHVAEGEERVARQEILIAELDHDGHAELAVKSQGAIHRVSNIAPVAAQRPFQD
jgi:hypothetical protein